MLFHFQTTRTPGVDSLSEKSWVLLGKVEQILNTPRYSIQDRISPLAGLGFASKLHHMSADRHQSGRRLIVRCSISLSSQHTECSFMNPIPKPENRKSMVQDRISSLAGLGIAQFASICRETWNVCQQCTEPILYQFTDDSELNYKSLPYFRNIGKGSL